MGKWHSINEKQEKIEKLLILQSTLKEQRKILKSTRDKEFNAILEQSIFNINNQLKEISRQLHVLKQGIRHQEQRQEENQGQRKINKNSAVFKKYGKPLKDLTRKEYNEYQSRTERKARKIINYE